MSGMRFSCYNSAMILSVDEVKKLARLARIELSNEEIALLQGNLGTILDYVEELKKVNTEGLEEVSQVAGLENVQREDRVVLEENREEIFKQAPEMKDGYFKVKAIL